MNQTDRGKKLLEKIRDKTKEWNEKGKRKDQAKVEALCEHLKQMGLNATVEPKKSSPFSSILGYVRVANRNIDVVELELAGGDSMALVEAAVFLGGGGYRCNYVVQAKVNGLEDRLKAKLEAVRKGFLSTEVVDFKWTGMKLAQILNSDASLRTTRYGSLEIKPDKKHQCVKIRENSAIGLYYRPPELAFPTIEAFEIYDRIAQHIRSIANVRP